MFDPPKDGIVTCVKKSSGKVCSLACKQGFDFARDPALFYVCGGSDWSFVALPPADLSVPWPNKCEVRSTPSKMKSYGFTKYYYTGDASKPSTQAEIKKNFKALLNEPYSQDSFCKNNALCTDNNIEILYDKGTVQCESYNAPAGLSDGRIANSSITASSHYTRYPPWKARLNSGSENAWYALPWDLKAWIQVDLGRPTIVAAVATQGKRFSHYVKTYKLGFSDDGKSWKMYKENSQDKIFQGNTDPYKAVTRKFKGIKARFFRIYPQTWNHGLALKFELYTCLKFT